MPQPRLIRFALAYSAFVIGVSSCSDSDDGGTPGRGGAGSTQGGAGVGGTRAGAGPVGGNDTVAGRSSSHGGAENAAGAAGSNAAGEAGAGGGGECAGYASCTPPSCVGLSGTECQGGSCCVSFTVPGGTFQQGEPDAFSSRVDSFVLDELEVTVARFRRFVAGYNAWLAAGNPLANAGYNVHVSGSGWQPAWTASLPASDSALEAALSCGSTNRSTWTKLGNDALPINCVDWYTAFAFCIWDGGRLPTDAEAEYAAAAGSRDNVYPWGNMPVLTDNPDASASYATYLCLADGVAGCSAADLPAAGSKPDGRGYYRQLDLVGSVWEWSLDYWAETYPSGAQTNYAKLDAGTYRTVRGGSWDNTAKLVNSASRTGMTPTVRYDTVGIRCARNTR